MRRPPPRSTLFPYTTLFRSKMRDLRDVSSIFVTHGLDNVRFLTSTYTCIDGKGEALFMKEENRLCLINTKIIDRKSTRLNSSHGYISYAVFCLKKKIITKE